MLASCERATAAAAEVLRLRKRSALVFTGCGTSGRIAFLTARRFNALQGEECCAYLISGGDSALLLSNELPEDDPVAGAAELAAIARGRAAVMLFGVSCGLSAPYVAGQLDHALASPQPADSPLAEGGIAAAAVGFNPASLSRRTPIAAWAGRERGDTFHGVVGALEKRVACGSPWHALLNPVVGPEAVAGSSRMKGGSATLILLDVIAFAALERAKAAAAAGGGGGGAEPLREQLVRLLGASCEAVRHPSSTHPTSAIYSGALPSEPNVVTGARDVHARRGHRRRGGAGGAGDARGGPAAVRGRGDGGRARLHRRVGDAGGDGAVQTRAPPLLPPHPGPSAVFILGRTRTACRSTQCAASWRAAGRTWPTRTAT